MSSIAEVAPLLSISFREDRVTAVKSTEAARDWVSKSAIGLVPFPPEVLEGDTMIDIVREAMAGPAQPEN
jgi:hypothetical protein